MGCLWMRLEYEIGDAIRVCPGIHKVRVRPGTGSVFFFLLMLKKLDLELVLDTIHPEICKI